MTAVPNDDGPETLFLSLATSDYIPQLLALKASLECVYGPAVRLTVLVIGGDGALAFGRQRGLDAIGPEDLGISGFWDMAFRYEKGAFANALKAFFIAHAMRTRRPRTAVFLDADTLVYSPLDELHAILADDGTFIVLTPHFERPQPRAREPRESDLLRAGMTNGGFVALRAGRPAEDFLAWWSDHMRADCRYELDQGLYGDQHWLDLVPSLFDGVRILRHRGYNAAYWNFPDRRPRRENGNWMVDADPLRFFHFSQWRIAQGETVEDCMGRLFQGGDDELRTLLVRYREALRLAAAAAPREVLGAPYPYGRFLDGTPIPKIVRDAYAAAEPLQSADRNENFGRGLEKLLLRSSAFPAHDGVLLPELYVHIWRCRPDLHNGRIDLHTREGQLAMLEWVLSNGAADYDLPDVAVEPANRALEGRIDLALPSRAQAKANCDEARASLARARQLHRAPVKTDRELGALLAQAGHLLKALFALAALPEPNPPAHCEAMFALVAEGRTALGQHAGADLLAREFERIEAHRRYWADKRSEGEGTSPGPSISLDADAVVNSCGDLTAIVEILVRSGRYPSAGSEVPPGEAVLKAG